MPRAIIYAVVICTLMLTGLVAYDMHQRGNLLPKKEPDAKQTIEKTSDKLPKTNANSVTITAEIKGIRTTRGNIVVQLYDDLNAFNNNSFDKAVANITTPAKGFSGKLTFNNLDPKKYAIVLFHDENSNQRYDQNGATMEGYAYSNGAGKISLPNFHQAAFSADKDKQLIINMIYH